MNCFQPFRLLLVMSLASMTTAASLEAKGPKAGAHVAKAGSKGVQVSASPKSGGAPKTGGSPKASGGHKSGKTTAETGKSMGATKKLSTSAAPASALTTTSPTGAATGNETGTTTTTPPPAPPATTTPPAAPNAISTRISRNPEQKARVTAMLPQGMTLEQASAGFRNQGQFIAAVNASRSESVPFARLKTEMVDNNMSLGQAVKHVRNTPAPAPTAPPTTPTTPTPPVTPPPTTPTTPPTTPTTPPTTPTTPTTPPAPTAPAPTSTARAR